MSLYALMVVHRDEFGKEYTAQSGSSISSLKRLRVRLSKKKKGYIQDIQKGTVMVARGFSRDAMEAIKACGVSVQC